MDVTQEASELQGFTTFQAPLVSQRQAQTTITVRDGETVILGGIIREQDDKTINKVPVLGDLPVLGNLFRSRGVTKAKTELMVFLTPRIVRNADQAAIMTQEQRRQIHVQIPPSPGPIPGGPEEGMLVLPGAEGAVPGPSAAPPFPGGSPAPGPVQGAPAPQPQAPAAPGQPAPEPQAPAPPAP
jgi:general secretion pathway protein D